MPTILILTVILTLPGIGRTEPAEVRRPVPSIEACQRIGLDMLKENDATYEYAFSCQTAS